ncbi:MAG TPA: sugar transferase, partial [Candidatus Acidoferrales bacterium]|nr:sugar transferase [Candidatus Acidoferrales bacterium]
MAVTAAPQLVSSPELSRLSRPWVATLLTADVLGFLLSAFLGTRIAQLVSHESLDASRIALSVIVYVALWLWLFNRLGLYERSFAMTMQDEVYATIAALSLGIAPQLILFTLVPSLSSSRLVLLTSLGLSIATVTTMRAIAHRVREVELLARERRVALVGNAARLRAACEELALVPNTHVLSIPVDDLDLALATTTSLEELWWFVKLLRWECDTLIFADVPDPRHVPSLLAASRKWGLHVAFAVPRIRAYSYQLRTEMLGHQALIVPAPVRISTSAARLVKRATDVCGAVLMLPFAPRVAVRILRGELSLVGPRMHEPQVAESSRAFNPRYVERMLVRPGVTGWAQVHGAHASDERELAYDLFYVENWGLFLDAYVIVKAAVGLVRKAVIASQRY